MNHEQKIARLQGLLDRVQTRAKQGRPAPRAAVAAPQAAASGLGFEIVPVAMPTSEPFDAEETRPFAKMPTAPPLQQPPSAEQPKPYDDGEVEISMGESDIDIEIDDVGEGGLEILGEAGEDVFMEEPGSSPRMTAKASEALDLDIGEGPRHTPPPESGPQEVPADSRSESKPTQLEVDESPRERGTPEHPSIEMLGQTVDLPGGTIDKKLELDQKPVLAPLRDRPTGEMEAVIPGSLAPGVYPPEAAHDTDPFGDLPLTNDWDLPSDARAKAKTPTPIPTGNLEVEPAATKPEALELDEAFEAPAKPVDEKPAEPEPAKEEPVDEKPAEPEPAKEEPVDEEPAEPEPAKEEPVDEKPAEPEPAKEEPVDEKPAEPEPAKEEPVDEKPAEPEPAKEEPVDEKPAEPEPAKEEPVDEKPAEPEPVKEEPVAAKPASDADTEAVTKRPTELDLQERAARDYAEAQRLESPSKPLAPAPQVVHVEIAGKVIALDEMDAEGVAVFVGAVEPVSVLFLDVLDASLALGKE